MGFFKTEEEKLAIIAEKKELEERIVNSPMTQIIINIIMDKFGDLNAEKIQMLRELRASTALCGYKLIVQKDGVIFSLLDMGKCLEEWGISFDAMGYEDLPKEGTYILEKIIRDTLLGIPHLTINDNGLFLYNKDRVKMTW